MTAEKKTTQILSIASVVDKTQTHIVWEYVVRSDFTANHVCKVYPLKFFVRKKKRRM